MKEKLNLASLSGEEKQSYHLIVIKLSLETYIGGIKPFET